MEDMRRITYPNAMFTLWLHCLENSLLIGTTGQNQHEELVTLYLIYIMLSFVLIRVKYV
jgi:hypothetical protein